MTPGLINPNPKVHERKPRRTTAAAAAAAAAGAGEDGGVGSFGEGVVAELDEELREEFDAGEIFEHIRDISDPEHPYTLEQLDVVSEDNITCDDHGSHVLVNFTPTVQHCSMATLIGLCIRVKLMRCLPSRFKVDIQLSPGSHTSEAEVNKQLNDKERVAAALENPNLSDMVYKCLVGSQL